MAILQQPTSGDCRNENLTRRDFLHTVSLAAAAATTLKSRRAVASPFGLPVGLQLYSVREELAADYVGTLVKVAAAGYQEVEAAGYFGKTPPQVRQAMAAAGLRCVSAHYAYDDLARGFDKILAANAAIGVQYLICSFPGIKDPTRLADLSYNNRVRSFTLDDYRWNADKFNRFGAKIKAAGMRFGYHNHTMEFQPQHGVVPFDELMRLTDPELVTFELDCGWVMVGGGDPVAYLKRYPLRISMLHVKDFKASTRPTSVTDPPPAAELGRGTLDYKPVFEAASRANLKHYFVEQEAYNLPVFESLQIDADYMKQLKA